MPNFAPDQVSFDDLPGYGFWDVGHAREHMQFVAVLASLTPPIVIADYPLLPFLTGGAARKAVLQSHMDAHKLLRQATGAAGVDYSQIDLDSQDDFYSFLQYHRDEHSQIRSALGII
jgi:hypothetical protein